MSLDAAPAATETLAMLTPEAAAVHLHRVDAARNMRRFYALTLEPTLFGEVALVRAWGRIGTAGQTMTSTFASENAARAALARLAGQKCRRGYHAAKLPPAAQSC